MSNIDAIHPSTAKRTVLMYDFESRSSSMCLYLVGRHLVTRGCQRCHPYLEITAITLASFYLRQTIKHWLYKERIE